MVKRQLGKWYVCLAVEVPDAKPIYVERPAVGRDMGLKSLLALSDGVIVLAKLPLQFMTKNQHLALSAHDAGLGLFQQLLGYKVEEAGSQVVEVDPKYTTQACSGCGALVHKSLKVRVHQCLDCDLGLDRNVNAARNILNLGLNALGRSAQVLTWRVAARVA